MSMRKRIPGQALALSLVAILALTLGVTAVGCVTYSLLVTTGFVVDEEVNDIFMLMMITYAASTITLALRHR